MKHLYLVISALLLAVALPIHLNAQNNFWEPLNGPHGDPSAAITRTANGTLLVATTTGIFRSENNGATWTRSDAGINDQVRGFAVHPGGTIVERELSGHMQYSTDDGLSWQLVHLDLESYYALSLTTSPEGIMYAGGMSGLIGHISGVFRSTDGGINWDSIGLNGANISAVLADTGGVIIAGINGFGDVGYTELQRSTDNGTTWMDLGVRQDLIYGGSIMALARDSSGAYWLAQTGGLHRSTDRGLTWDSIPSPFMYPDHGIYNFAVAPDGRLMIGTTSGPYRSTDNGVTWDTSANWQENIGVLDFSFDATMMFAATDIGVLVSTDGGNTWNERNNGITANIRELAASGSQSLMVLNEFGVQFSTDAGTTWQRRLLSPRNAYSVGVSPDDDLFIGYLLVNSAHGSLHRSTDNGTTWTTSTPSNAVYNIDFNSAGHVFAAMQYKTIQRSTDNGTTWTSATVPNDSYEIQAFAFDSTRAGYAATYSGLLRTTDNGSSWVTTSITDPVNDVTVDPAGTVYAASEAGVYRSSDQGATWTRVYDSVFTSLVATGANDLLASHSTPGVLRSTNGGITWNDASTGLPDIVTSLVRNRNGVVYAGTQSYGVYRLSTGPLSVPQSHDESADIDILTRASDVDISITCGRSMHTGISIYNSLGERIGTLLSDELTPGTHRVTWHSNGVPSGIYYISICRDGSCVTRMVSIAQ